MDPLFSQIIINDAYREPERHLNLLRAAASEPELLPGRRLPGYYVGGRSEAGQLVAEREWRELEAVNRIRERVGRWRSAGYPSVTPVTRSLLECWSATDRAGINLFFCQREAAETIIWLVEAPESDRANLGVAAPDPFVRHCCKMATGSGKTTVMAMLAAWSVINKVTNRQDPRFCDAVLVVCPNLTVKERLQVLLPSHAKNEYDQMGLLPPGTDFKERLSQGKWQISNWHQLAGASDAKRQIVQRGEESDAAFCKRVLHDIGKKDNLLVFNDEAHHAYRKNPEATDAAEEGEELLETEDIEEFEREATVWVEGLDRIHQDRGIRLCVDVTATPYYIARSGYEDGKPFPWIVTDFGLVDAVECGIVKVPRVPRGDDSGASEPRYLHLWEHIKGKLPKRVLEGDPGDTDIVRVLMEAEGALQSLAYLWHRTFKDWQARGSEVPPCMIVVCNNTRTADVLTRFIESGRVRPELQDTETEEHTLRIDSALLRQAESEGGDAKADLMRRKVSTVGKPGPPEEYPGGQIRCVVSVAMLSEGWDARNVTQILGLRAFSSQLLCEQVIGRGLRRSSYESLAEPEFVDIYGIPFQLLPVQQHAAGGVHKPVTSVRALPDRAELEITIPRVVGFFNDVGTEIDVDESLLEPITLTAATEPGHTIHGEGVTYYGGAPLESGLATAGQTLDAGEIYGQRLQTTIYEITRQVVDQMEEQHRPYLFKRVLAVTRKYVDTKVIANGLPKEMVALQKYQSEIVNRIRNAIRAQTGEAIQLPIYDLVQPLGTTRYVNFTTRKPVYETKRSHVNYVVCDPANDKDPPREKWPNLWEYRVAKAIDEHPAVRSFVKNDHLELFVPYTYEGASSRYAPDFVVILRRTDGSDLNLLLEVKGEEDNRDRAKYSFARAWVAAVNRDGEHGTWAFDVVKDPRVESTIDRWTKP
ncbi:MAG: DEAD/DEAH box helicase family protein [Acidobacteriota bacterium]